MKERFNIFNPQKCRTRWLCYFDLLGFRKLVTRHGSDCGALVDAVHRYYQSREIVEDWVKRMPHLHLVNFSDTFLIYSDDDSQASFSQMEQAARFIMNEHLARHIPIRGALSCGALYADEADDIQIGIPLIEAYEHADNQGWIGFLLCRSATQRLTGLKLPPSRRLNYRPWPIPWKRKKRGQKPLYAYLIGASCTSKGKNDYIEILRQMLVEAETRKDKNRYRKAIEFLERCGVWKAVEAMGDERGSKSGHAAPFSV